MVIGRSKYGLLLLTFLLVQQIYAQHLTSSVSVNTSRVYVGEPVEVTVSVFTSTWFTAGIDIQNIKVNGAFTVPFRTLSTSKSIKGKTYAGVQFFYNVFPYSEEDIEFPSLNIEVETPDDGGYKGVKRKIVTTAKTIKVRPIPPGFKKSEWLVTPNLRVNDKWGGDLKNVKVGDVLEREIHRNAALTVSELIPPVEWNSIFGISYYPNRATTQNIKTKTSFSAERTDAMRYLFLEEGEVIIPEIQLMWWNAAQKKVYKRTLKEVVIIVEPNPDLGMVASIKDSLDAMKTAAISEELEKDKPFEFMGMNWKQLALAILLLLIFLKYAWKLIQFVWGKYQTKHRAYLESEKYYFDLFLKSLPKSDQEKLTAFYRWLDCLALKEYTLEYFSSSFMESTLACISASKPDWIKARNRLLDNKSFRTTVRAEWINP